MVCNVFFFFVGPLACSWGAQADKHKCPTSSVSYIIFYSKHSVWIQVDLFTAFIRLQAAECVTSHFAALTACFACQKRTVQIIVACNTFLDNQ